MNETLKHIKTAFAWLSRIPVTDDAVDFMAMARQELREAKAIEEAKDKSHKNTATEKLEPIEEG